MTQDFILHTTPKTELVAIIQEAIKTELASLVSKDEVSKNELYTRKEVAKLLSVSLPTLHEWTKDGVITAYRIGSSIRYKHADVQKALVEIQSIKYQHNKKGGAR